MKRDSSFPSDDETNVNADAIRDARLRVQERERRMEAERERNRTAQKRAWWDFDLPLGTTSGLLSQALGANILIVLALVGVGLLVSALSWLTGALRIPFYWMVRSLDIVTGAGALTVAPWVVWTFWGAIFGGALGHWLVAPLYGNRENRSLLLWLPLLGMIVIGAICWAFIR